VSNLIRLPIWLSKGVLLLEHMQDERTALRFLSDQGTDPFDRPLQVGRAIRTLKLCQGEAQAVEVPTGDQQAHQSNSG
jgi:hypothetical protein